MDYPIAHGDELYHHGIKGQKWGVRRFQNRDGTYTSAGKARRNGSEEHSPTSWNKEKTKKALAIAGVLTVAAAGVYVASNPKMRTDVVSAAKKLGSTTSSNTKTMAKLGKEYARLSAQKAKEDLKKAASTARVSAKTAATNFKEGAKEGLLRDGPRKLGKTVALGAVMYGGKKMLDAAIGSNDAGRVFKANDPKKIGSFWAYIDPDKDDDG